MPLVLAEAHRSCLVGDHLDVVVRGGGVIDRWSVERLQDVVGGAGFDDVRVEGGDPAERPTTLRATAVRARTLPDVVGPGMALLVCGLNPSLYAADVGVGYARPGNRFWPAMRAAGLTTRDRDAFGMLHDDGIGTTDLVKRATTAASELSTHEFEAGVARVERLCRWLRPRLVYLVGLQGWRAAVDRRAGTGLQDRFLGGVRVYVGPSTSGLNASTQLPGHVAHLRAAAALAGLPAAS